MSAGGRERFHGLAQVGVGEVGVARDSFGRLLGTLTREGHNLADDLLEAGLAVPYSRKK